MLKRAGTELAAYFPNKETPTVEEVDSIQTNEWTVINCHINELQSKLRALPPGRKQVEVARFQEQVTVVICELEG